ncbi:hypothetical protein TNCV_164541 [Trichonephila clavipes]|nr:hypothetical protein TNCV_164541 [Trichonephila clavipes]
MQLSPPKDRLPVLELKTTQWSRSFSWESTQDRTTSAHKFEEKSISDLPFQADVEVTGVVPTPISNLKVHHVRGDNDQLPNCNTGFVQTEMNLHHVSLLKA